ncbi:hypothetical protein Bca52824_016330 [Brassica carinata]|uniref:Uncharacterized protein n=1 Tax=Brassica carinata TaxID=52824 RepID=A0A8X7W4W5_BRACI|nr:hypothetical protein Bca52824_016330 [Brassica carinata]
MAELSDGNTSDDLPEHPSERIKGQKRRRPSSGGGVSSRTRARKAVSYGNEPAKEVAVQQESAPVRDKTVVSLSLDAESEDMSVVSSKEEKQGWCMVVYEGITCETKSDEEVEEKAVKPDKKVEEPKKAAKPDEGAARTGICHRPKVMAVKGGSTRAERLANMRKERMKEAKKESSSYT